MNQDPAKKEPARSEGESFWGPIELVLKRYSAVDASSTNIFDYLRN